MRNYLMFDNTDLRDFGLYISGSGVFNLPEREYNEISVPGRNGNILNHEKRLSNIEIKYQAFIYKDFKVNIANLKSFLLSKIGYHKLIDTYNPSEYRLAYYSGGMDIEPTSKLDAGQFELVFNCKPQRFLLSGDEVTKYTQNGILNNMTRFNALPLIRVYGVGSFTINDITVTITAADGYTDIDCELMDAYKGIYPKNDSIQLSGNDFPVLKSGINTITLNGVTIDITPRWWTV